MNQIKGLLKLAFCMIVLAGSVSCSDDNDGENAPKVSSPFVLSLAVQGSDGGFTYYSVPFADVMSGSLTAQGNGIEQPGYYDFTQIDETIFSIGGLDDVDVIGITYDTEDSVLTQLGSASYDNSLSDIVKADDNTLVAVEMSSSSDQVKFHTLDVNSVSAIKTVSTPVSDLTNAYAASYSGMAVVGDHLFLAYYISDPETFATPYTSKARVAVYSYPDFTFEKIIEDTRVGSIGGFNVKSGLIKDENDNVYALSHSNKANGYSEKTNVGGILKINAGEIEFDTDYFFDMETVTDGKNTAHLKYLGNGKVFTEVNQASFEDQGAWSDSPLKSAVLDLNAQTVAYIDGVPEHSGNGRRLAALQKDEFVYLCIPETSGIYVYKMDTENLTATKGALVEANFVAGFFKF